jgi:hypothetical protein
MLVLFFKTNNLLIMFYQLAFIDVNEFDVMA